MGETGQNHEITPQQAEDTVKWVVAETYGVFERRARMQEQFNRAAAKPFDINTDPLTGYCGDAQSFIDLTLRDYGMDSKPFAMQTLMPDWRFGHVALTSTFETTEGPKTYLVDPTFRQFLVKGPPNDPRDPPGIVMQGLAGGEEMLEALTTKGYIELTPARAMTYLTSFSDGIPPRKTEAEAMQFFDKPNESEMNRYFSREVLVKRGIYI